MLFTSESVTEGHPDKVCDQISDAVLDAILTNDPMARVACETACTTGLINVIGEISTHCYVDIPAIIRSTVKDIGYTRAKYGFDADTCGVLTSIHEQSEDIARGVDNALEKREGSDETEIGAGDQGMMFGFACDETLTLMPAPIYYAHKIARQLTRVRKEGILPWLRPDGKSMVTVVYENGRPVGIQSVVVAAQHAETMEYEEIKREITEKVILPCLPGEMILPEMRILVNETGRFVIGGPMGDSGLTGRKIIVDTYGGYARHGGGAFSGKDPTKVDRSAAYAVRWVAKHLVAAGLVRKCEIQVAYAIGVARPVSIYIEDFGTASVDKTLLYKIIDEVFDLQPASIIRDLRLRRPIYQKTAAYGHFGREDVQFPWEELSRLEAVKAAAGV